jgi:hypothetical protein
MCFYRQTRVRKAESTAPEYPKHCTFPTKKKPYPTALRLQSGPESVFWNMRVINPTGLRVFSYLKIDTHYEVPLDIQKEQEDGFSRQLMLCLC